MNVAAMVGAAVPDFSDSEYSQDSVMQTARNGHTKAEQIKCLVQEIADTEADYFTTFVYLTSDYQNPLHDTKLIEPAMLDILFPPVLANIQKLSADILHDFMKIAATWNEDSCIGDRFRERIPHLNLYKPYVRDFDERSQALLLLRKNSKFQAFEAEKLKMNVPPLESLLMKPVQRTSKYKLFLQNLLKWTRPDHPDYENLEKAYNMLEGVLESINFSMKDWEERIKVLKADMAFGRVLDLKSNPARRLLMRSKLYKIGKSREWLHFLLFNDMLVYASGKEDKLTLRKKLDLPRCQLKLDDLEDFMQVDKEFAMFLRSTEKSFIVCAESQEVKDQWLAVMDRLEEIHTAEKAREEKAQKSQIGVSEMLRRGTFLPVMQAKNQISTCTDCTKPFGWRRSKQNCTRCGRVFCKACLRNTVQSPTTRKKAQICNHCNQIQTHVRRCSQVELVAELQQARIEAMGTPDEVMELVCQIRATKSEPVISMKRQPERKQSWFSWKSASSQVPPKRGPEVLQRQKSSAPEEEERKDEEEMVLPLASPSFASELQSPESEFDDDSDEFEQFYKGEIYFIKDEPCTVSSIKNGQVKLKSGKTRRTITLDATKSVPDAIREYLEQQEGARIEKQIAAEKAKDRAQRTQMASQRMLDTNKEHIEGLAETIREQSRQIERLREENEAATIIEAQLREVIDQIHQSAPADEQDRTRTLMNAIRGLTGQVREQDLKIEHQDSVIKHQNSKIEQQEAKIKTLESALGDLMMVRGGEHFQQTNSANWHSESV